MKVIVDLTKKTLKVIENERSIFRGEYGADKLTLLINKQLVNEYPTITALLSNGRKLGAYTTDDVYGNEVIDGVTYTTANFTLSKENGFTLSEGKMQVTIWMNSDGKKEAIGNLLLNVVNTTAFDDENIIISDDVTGAVVNIREEINNAVSQVNLNGLAVNNLDIKVKNFKDLGIVGNPMMEPATWLNEITTAGTYTMNYSGVQLLMLVSNTAVGITQILFFDFPNSADNIDYRIRTSKDGINWTYTDDYFVKGQQLTNYKSEIDRYFNSAFDYITILQNTKADITYVNQKINDLFGEGQVATTLDTIVEIAKAIENNQEVVEALNNSITNKADKSYVDNSISMAIYKTLNTEV